MTIVGEVCNQLLGPCIHRLTLSPREKTIFLTFDDGPHETCTEAVLDLLERHEAQATFFMVANRATRRPDLVQKVLEKGHTIGNHSLDHRYQPFFQQKEALGEWVTRSQEILRSLSGQGPIGFRSPAGVRTPALHEALIDLKIPLVHWDHRFFDTQFSWTPQRAARSFRQIRPGSIVLLHDTHQGRRKKTFLSTLDFYCRSLRQMGFQFGAIQPDQVHHSV